MPLPHAICARYQTIRGEGQNRRPEKEDRPETASTGAVCAETPPADSGIFGPRVDCGSAYGTTGSAVSPGLDWRYLSFSACTALRCSSMLAWLSKYCAISD